MDEGENINETNDSFVEIRGVGPQHVSLDYPCFLNPGA